MIERLQYALTVQRATFDGVNKHAGIKRDQSHAVRSCAIDF